MATVNQASEHVGAVEYWVENEESLSYQPSRDEIEQFLEDVEHIEGVEQAPRL